MIHKYRAFEIKANKMWDVFRIDFSPGQDSPHTVLVGIAEDGCVVSKPLHNLSCDEPDFILMQFTGLSDKKGVEIYCGDVVKIILEHGATAHTEGRMAEKTVAVEWDEGYPDLYEDDILWIEVVGNKMQHPHLLKE